MIPDWWNDKGHGVPDWNPSFLEYWRHRIQGCAGYVVSDYDEDGHLWMALQCTTCGRILGAHISEINEGK